MKRILPLVVFIFALSAIGCHYAPHVAKIKDIKKTPGIYIKKECVIEGKTTSILDTPWLRHDLFKIHDGSDEIWVYTDSGVPPEKEKVRVYGTLKKLLSIPVLKLEIDYYIIMKKLEYI